MEKGVNAGVYGASAVLIFMDGMKEISQLVDAMRAHEVLGDRQRVRLCPLHSSLSTEDQRAVFVVPPEGITKIVIATNIAETSITINDISYCIDCGTHKEMTYDSSKGMSALTRSRCARSNAKQRAGRAGRVRSGICFHLFMRKEWDSMRESQLPEMLRCPLENIALRIKILKLGNIRDFLNLAIEPPSKNDVTHVLDVLSRLQALEVEDKREELTPLGFHLARLPLDPRLSRMLIYGSIFRCLKPILIIAACLERSPFYAPMDARDEADAQRRSFCATSDHIANLNAYLEWEKVASNTSKWSAAEKRFGKEHFLSLRHCEMQKACTPIQAESGRYFFFEFGREKEYDAQAGI